MTEKMPVLAIDQGTSATKAMVIDPAGEILGTATAAVAPRTFGGGAVEQDPVELLDSVLAAGRGAIAAAGVEVGAVGLGNQGETVLCWDRRSGEPRGAAIGWQDRRARAVVAALSSRAERLAEITGLPLDTYFAAPKMRWLRERLGALGAGETITTVDAWITYRLCGSFVTDAATASRTLLLDLDAGAWSTEACADFGLDPADLPRIAACDEVVGTTDAFDRELPLGGLIVDQQAALFAESCFEPGDAKCTYGTGAFLLANCGPEARRSTAGLSASVGWQLGDLISYCLDGQVYAAGAAIRWLEGLGLLDQADRLDASMTAADPEATPVFVPALAGLGAPRWAADARGAWVGLTLATGRDELVASVVAGIAAEVAGLVAATGEDLGAPLRRLRVDGGLSRSPATMQLQADLAGLPVETYPRADATALGVGALARLATGMASTPAEAVVAWEPGDVFEPSLPAAEAAARLEKFQRAADAQVSFARGGS